MPGNKPHHSQKWHDCVDKVMQQGHDEQSASAICTKSLQDAGTPIYEEGTASRRTIVLRGAAGQLRTAVLQEQEHTVIPVTALLEAVIWPVNAPTPELVPYETLAANPQEWDGRPVVLRHPVDGDEHTGANTPKVLNAQGIGTIFKSKIVNRQLHMEAWINNARIAKVKDLPETIAALKKGDPVEVSVGGFVVVEKKKGRYNGRDYGAIWREISPDHLAFLPDGDTGACSIAMGCGARALKAHPLAEKVNVVEPDLTWTPPPNTFDLSTLKRQAQRTPEDIKGRMQALRLQVTRVLQGDAKDITAETLTELMDQAGSSWEYIQSLLGEIKTADPNTPSYQALLESFGSFMSAMMGAMGAAMNASYCLRYPSDEAVAMMKASAGARHSKSDMEMVQSMHDMTVNLGADCGDGSSSRNAKTAAKVRHEGGRWAVYGQDGVSRLASHATKEEAEVHALAIDAILRRRNQSSHGRCKCGGEGAQQ